MQRILFAGVFFLHLSFFSRAQSGKKEDVLYLQNEWVIRGKIISQTDVGVKIQTSGGSVFYFTKNEISKITREDAWTNFIYKEKGFGDFTELGPLIAGKTTQEGVTTAAFSFQTVNGYKFSQYAFLGLGVGADLYATQTILPLFGSFRGDFTKKGSVIPFYFGDLGYGINITQSSTDLSEFKGGLHYAAGIGIKIPFNQSAGFTLSAGYNYQKTSYLQQGADKEVIYSRLAIRAGFFL